MPIDISKYGVGARFARPLAQSTEEDQDIGLLERGYNSTFGVLQQIILRSLRAAMDEDIDLFSREGILAPELIPVLGLFASHETDARASDVFGDQGILGNFALEMATDPFSYFAAPLTALAKGHRATQLLKGTNRTGQAFRNAGIEVGRYKDVGKLRKAVEGAAVSGHNKRKITKLLHGMDDGQDLAQLAEHANKIDLAVRNPFLWKMHSAPDSVQSYGSWWNWMNKSKASPVAWPRLAVGPVMRGVTRSASGEKASKIFAAFTAGLKAVRPRFTQAGDDATGTFTEAARVLGGHGDVVAHRTSVQKAIDATGEGTTFAKELAKRRDKIPPETRRYLDELGPDGTTDLLADIDKAEDAVKNIDRQMVETRPPASIETNMQKALWEKGQWVRKTWEIAWGSGSKITSKTLRTELNTLEHKKALVFNYLRANQAEAVEALKGLSKETSIDPDSLNKLFLAYAEMTPYSQDWANAVRNLVGGRVTPAQASKDFDAYFSHLDASLKTIEDIAGVSGLERLREASTARLSADHKYSSLRIGKVGFNKESSAWVSHEGKFAIDLEAREIDDLLQNLSPGAKKTRDKLEKIKLLKQQGGLKKTERSALVVDGEKTQAAYLDVSEHAYATLLEAQQLVLRAKKSGKGVDPVRYADLMDEAQAELRHMTDAISKEVFGESEHWAKIRGYHDEAIKTAHETGGLGFGSPLTYLPRSKVGAAGRAVKSALGKALFSALPQDLRASNLFARTDLRPLTIQQLNEFLDHKYIKALPEGVQADIVKRLNKAGIDTTEGVKLVKEDFIDLTMTRIGTDMDRRLHSNMVDNLFADKETAFRHGLRGGKITGKFKVQNGEVLMPKESKGVIKYGEIIQHKDQRAVPEIEEWLTIEHPDGTQGLLNVSEQSLTGEVFNLRSGGGATSLGDAFTLTAWNNSAQKSSTVVDGFKEGGYVVAGDAATLNWLRSATAPQPEQMRGFLEAYDKVNWFVKRFQTVLRPGHIVMNRLSGFGQSMAAGASPQSIVMAELDIQRMFGRFKKGESEHMNKLMQLSRANMGVTGRLENNFLGHKFMLAIGEMSLGKSASEVADSVGDMGRILLEDGDAGLLDVIELAVKEGLISGQFVKQELKLGGESLTELRRAADKTGFFKKMEDLTDIASGSETAARLQTLIALTYDGMDPMTAITRAKGAHVDYSDLTKFERTVVKRAIPYYTFARRFTPWAIERLKADGPGAPIQAAVKLMKSDAAGEMIFQDEYGQTQVRMPFETKLKLPRVLPQLEALSTVLGVAQMMDPWNQDKLRAQVPQAEVLGGGGGGVFKEALLGRRGEGASVRGAVTSVSRSLWPIRLLDKLTTGYDDSDNLLDHLMSATLSPLTGLQMDKSASLQAVAQEVSQNATLSAQDKQELLRGIYSELETETQQAKTRR